MKNKYDWNNIKEISDEKLFEEFSKSSLADKILIYRLLSLARRKKISQIWKEECYKKDLFSFLEQVREVFKPLDGFINIGSSLKDSDIKNWYEFCIVRGIVQEIGLVPLSEDKAINVTRDKENFEEARKKMIEILKKFEKREYGVFAQYHDNLLEKELEAIKYVKPVTKKEWEKMERKIYLQMLYEVGVGKERAKNIISAIEKWYKEIGKDISNNRRFDISYILNEEEEQMLRELSRMDSIFRYGLENISKDEKIEISKFLQTMKNKGFDEENYLNEYNILEWKKKQLTDKSFIETRKSDDFYKQINYQVIKTLYP